MKLSDYEKGLSAGYGIGYQKAMEQAKKDIAGYLGEVGEFVSATYGGSDPSKYFVGDLANDTLEEINRILSTLGITL